MATNTHGYKMTGLETVSQESHNNHLGHLYSGAYLQVFYNPEDDEVWSVYHNNGNEWTKYQYEDVIAVGSIIRAMSEQAIADKVYGAIIREQSKKEYSNDGLGIIYNCDVYQKEDGTLNFVPEGSESNDLKLIAKIREERVFLV